LKNYSISNIIIINKTEKHKISIFGHHITKMEKHYAFEKKIPTYHKFSENRNAYED
jgi:hypothetical protein